MINAGEAFKLLDTYSSLFRTQLGLTRHNIAFYVLHSQDDVEWMEKIGSDGVGPKGHTLWAETLFVVPKRGSPKKYEIVLYVDRIPTEIDFITTLFHELLHVKFRPLQALISHKNLSKFASIEEDIVMSVERALTSVMSKDI